MPDVPDGIVNFGTADGSSLVGEWGMPDGATTTEGIPIVVLATGDGPNGSSGQTWQKLAPMLNRAGFGTFLFDFAGLGRSPGDYKTLTLTRGCRDFRAAVELVLGSTSNDQPLGAIGSSFGGNVVLLEAANYSQIRAIGLKSASTFMPEGYEIELGHDQMAKWGAEGYLDEVDHTYDIVLDSLFHNTYAAASRIVSPIRIVNGTADISVPIRHARDLLRVCRNGTIFELEGANHWYAEGDEWDRMANDLVSFMVRELLNGGA